VIGTMIVAPLEIPLLVKQTELSWRRISELARGSVQICLQSRAIFFLMFWEALSKAQDTCHHFQLISFALSVHHWKQGSLMFMTVMSGVCTVPFFGIVLFQARKFGERKVWATLTIVGTIGSVVTKLLMPFSPIFMVLLSVFGILRGPAIEAITDPAKARFPHNQASSRGRSMACIAVMTKLLTAVMTLALAYVFDASATTFAGKAMPFWLLAVTDVVGLCLFAVFVWPSFAAMLDVIRDERVSKANIAETEPLVNGIDSSGKLRDAASKDD